MKQELLEALTRLCVREVISQMREEDKKDDKPEDTGDTKGAPAPPADGQGSSDQPPVSKDKPERGPAQEKPENDVPVPSGAGLKGVILVNPRDKSKLQQISLRATSDDASLERNLHKLVSTLAWSHAKVSLQAQRMAKDAVRNPSSSVYLYLGKYDPSSDEIFLMADKSLQVAKDSSVPPSELTGTPTSNIAPGTFDPALASDSDYAAHLAQGPCTPRHGVDETMAKIVKKLVREILEKR